MKQLITGFFGIILIAVIVYSSYWIIKTVSYGMFYEDMVIETIHETVKPGALK